MSNTLKRMSKKKMSKKKKAIDVDLISTFGTFMNWMNKNEKKNILDMSEEEYSAKVDEFFRSQS